jgi:hypothetical protein
VFALFRSNPAFRLLLFTGTAPAGQGSQTLATFARIGQDLREATDGLVQSWLITDPHNGPQEVAVPIEDNLPEAPLVLLDPDRSTHRSYGADTACVYLVRPDGYIGFRSRLASAPKLADYLRRTFGISASGSQTTGS